MWDSQDRLAECVADDASSTRTCNYTYGADGLRRSQSTSTAYKATLGGAQNSGGTDDPSPVQSQPFNATTLYAYDGTMPVREMQANAQGALAPTATYLNGPRGPEYRRDDTQTEGTYTDGAGHTQIAGKTRWYVYDGLGSVVGEVDPGGNLTSSGTFDVYGAKRAGGSTGSPSTRQGFVGQCGHVSDGETGLIYMRARYYDPQTGKFVSEDPGRNGANWYAYCGNNPVNEVDQTGKMAEWLEHLVNGLLIALTAALVIAAIAALSSATLMAGLAVWAGLSVLAWVGLAAGITLALYGASEWLADKIFPSDSDPSVAMVPMVAGLGMGEAIAIADLGLTSEDD